MAQPGASLPMIINALGACHAQCPWCARHFWDWVKTRMRNANKEDGRSGEGSFASAAATSVRAE